MKKHTKITKPLFIVLIFFAFLSCKNDNDSSPKTQSLIGAWQRSDVSDNFEYTLTFDEGDSGFRVVREINNDGQVISSARTFIWMVTENLLTLNYDDEEIVTTYYNFDENGNLFLSGFSTYYFMRVE